jgi:3-hydroxy-9,10-secoandrosta-1,3,5(10)-triene-9,17-dione monooxygenase
MTNGIEDAVPYDAAERALEDEMIARAWALVPEIRASAAESERLRYIQPAVMQKIQDAGLFQLMVPKRFGGMGLGFRPFVEIGRIFARGDASTAWASTFIIEHNWMACHLPMEGQERIFDGRNEVKASASLQPDGVAVKVDGGWEITGTWRYASGTGNSDYAMVSCHEGEPGAQKTRAFWLPLTDVVVHDDWFMSGLSASSSCTLSGEKVFVPDYYSIDTSEFHSATGHPGAVHEESSYRYANVQSVNQVFAAIALGSAEEVVARGKELLPRSRPWGLARTDREASRVRWGKAYQLVRMATLLYENSLRMIIRKGEAVEAWSDEDAAHIALDHATIVHLSQEAINVMMDGLGSGVYRTADDNPLPRYQRDVNVIANHLAMDIDVVQERSSRYLLGLGRKFGDPFFGVDDPDLV